MFFQKKIKTKIKYILKNTDRALELFIREKREGGGDFAEEVCLILSLMEIVRIGRIFVVCRLLWAPFFKGGVDKHMEWSEYKILLNISFRFGIIFPFEK